MDSDRKFTATTCFFLLVGVVLISLAFNCTPSKSGNTAKTTVTVANHSTDTTVYVAFSADSKVTASDWSFCTGSGLTCSFPLAKNGTQPLSNPSGKYLNATFAFGSPVGCGATKAEVNVNNPAWYDILDVSLVDGYSNNIQITATPTGKSAIQLGPPKGKTGNEKVYGVFPFGCDICVARQNPPCGISKGTDGCHAGTQYDPKPPCQYQGPTKGGGNLAIEIALMP
jgi:hypothetical protein